MNRKLKFAHLADSHLGSFRESHLKELNFLTFKKSIAEIIKEKVDFVIFAGDLFNSPVPSLDLVGKVVDELKKLKEKNIPIYVIGGSHDYSNTGKSFIPILDKTGIFTDVGRYEFVSKNEIRLKYTINDNLKIRIIGVLGRKKGLDKNIYKNISKQDLNGDYFNIFVFHTMLNNFKPSYLENTKTEITKEFLPKGFDYYAGGHIHTFMKSEYFGSPISYSGCLFPNNFSELVRETPGFNLCEFDFNTRKVSIKRVEIKLYEKIYVKIDIDNLNPIEAGNYILEKIETLDFTDKICLLKISGIINGKVSDVNLNNIINIIYSKNAILVLRNTNQLTSSVLQDRKVTLNKTAEEIEEFFINEISSKITKELGSVERIKDFFKIDFSKREDEINLEYQKRVTEIFDKFFLEE